MNAPRTAIFKPDFLIIGAQKSGTTWLHERLRGQPGTWLPADKDFELLSYRHHSESDEWRERWNERFAGARDTDLTGDSCASYLWAAPPFPEGFNRDIPGTAVASFGDRLRVIALLRDPAERAVSGYLHHIAHGSLDWNLRIDQAPEALGIVALGRYGAQLEAWQNALPPDQILVLPGPGEVDGPRLLAAAGKFLEITTEARESAGDVIHAGLERRRDEAGGVWVRPDDPALRSQPVLSRPVPLEVEVGRQWIRLVHPAEIQKIREWLSKDRARLSKLLKQRPDQPGHRLWTGLEWAEG